jgi:hypothetical protein
MAFQRLQETSLVAAINHKNPAAQFLVHYGDEPPVKAREAGAHSQPTSRVTESWVGPLREEDVPPLAPPPATAKPWRVGPLEGA